MTLKYCKRLPKNYRTHRKNHVIIMFVDSFKFVVLNLYFRILVQAVFRCYIQHGSTSYIITLV